MRLKLPRGTGEALGSLITDPPRRRDLGHAARLRVVSEFGMEENISRLAAKFGLAQEEARRAGMEPAACA